MAAKPNKDVVRPNVVDGIEEYDNPLPGWWVWLFNLTILFGLAYMIWYHVLGKPGLDEELVQDQQAHEQNLARNQPQEGASPESLVERVKDPKRIEEGKGIYATNCAPCHGAVGEGVVGPNLTDQYWLHGGTAERVKITITEGVPAKGMIGWGPILGTQKVEAVLAYVLSLQGTNPPNGKAPEGDAN